MSNQQNLVCLHVPKGIIEGQTAYRQTGTGTTVKTDSFLMKKGGGKERKNSYTDFYFFLNDPQEYSQSNCKHELATKLKQQFILIPL